MSVNTKHDEAEGTSSTRNQQLAVWFQYAGLELLRIEKEGDSLRFIHRDPEFEAAELETWFFEPDGDTATSARELLKADRHVREAVRQFYRDVKTF